MRSPIQLGELTIVARFIGSMIPDLDSLGTPNVIKKMATEKHGLILIVGAAASGKSTTVASMLDYRNMHLEGHILTVEDPIEYTHSHKMCIISQREIGTDTKNYEDALKYALREKPDTIMIGEIRDIETAKYALRFAETGHLCISTLHANNTTQAIDRFLNLFSETEQRWVRHDLSQYLVAIIAQRFAFSKSGNRILVSEVMMNNHFISTLIIKGETEKIKAVMGEMDNQSQTFDKVLCDLVNKNAISREEALRVADSRINLSLMLTSGDDNLYDESDFSQDKATREEIDGKQHRIDMARERKNKRAAQKQAR
jgi:twitching motility protein PilU